MHYALTRLWILPPSLARLGEEAESGSPKGLLLLYALLLLSSQSSLVLVGEETLTEASPRRLQHFSPWTTPRCVLSLTLSLCFRLTHKHAHSRQTHTARLSFLALGLEMGRWAEKVCHQQKRTE